MRRVEFTDSKHDMLARTSTLSDTELMTLIAAA